MDEKTQYMYYKYEKTQTWIESFKNVHMKFKFKHNKDNFIRFQKKIILFF